MGGEAARERRRLKRLQESEGAATAPTSSLSSARIENPSNQPKANKDRNAMSSADAARIRLQRKLARKASGKFRPQAQTKRSSTNPISLTRRKLEDVEDNFREAKPPHVRRLAAIPKDRSSRQSSPTNRKRIPYKNEKQPTKKERKPTDKKKPKHLKRKIEQLSKTFSEGSSISDLDTKMKLLQTQLEEYKRLKLRSDDKDNVDASVSVGATEVDADMMGMSDKQLGDTKEPKSGKGDGECINEHETIVEKTQPKVEDEKKRSSEPSDCDSSDDDDLVESFDTRSRGKRRRGRRDSALKEELKDDSRASGKSETIISCPKSSQENHGHNKLSREKCDTPLGKEKPNSPQAIKKTLKADDRRRCIGRKPITDFEVGLCYSGTVKYIKPKLGAFIDIGSHSDAFCHISCISDEFVANVTDVLKVDDIVQNARVVEVDREKKRITVSLRSEEMKENELEVLKSRRQYENNYDAKKRDRHKSVEGASERRPAKKDSDIIDGNKESNLDPVTSSTGEQIREENVPGDQKSKAAHGLSEGRGSDASSAQRNAGVDLKRERKLARRAERRAAAAEAANGNSSQ